jgi:hypothetical protein
VKDQVKIHYILEDGPLLTKVVTKFVPRVGEEIRLGGEGNEKYYKTTRVIWAYDEFDSLCERVNIGIIETT